MEEQPKWTIDTYNGELPKWREVDIEEIKEMFSDVADYTKDGELINIDMSRLNFGLYDEAYFREKYGDKFPDEFYKIMADACNKDNKIQDFRTLPLDIKNEDVILKFE
jgi:hypothetical protein